ncbi:MAG: alpha/beta hydrolase [Hyphomicrobiales bacterium]
MTNVQCTSLADGESQSVVCDDDVGLNFRQWQCPSREAILFFHDLGSHQEQFSADADFFAETGYCTAALDLRGHGLSTVPP